jgi:hypothetical protein
MVTNKPGDGGNGSHTSKSYRRRMMAAAEAERSRAVTEAKKQHAAARRVRLLVGISIVGAVAMVPISMLIAQAVAENLQDDIFQYLLGSALTGATGLACVGIHKSRSLPVEPDGLSFQVFFGSAVLTGCGILTDQAAFIVVPLIPAAYFWSLSRFRRRSHTESRNED